MVVVAQPADIDALDATRRTPLLIAAEWNRRAVVNRSWTPGLILISD